MCRSGFGMSEIPWAQQTCPSQVPRPARVAPLEPRPRGAQGPLPRRRPRPQLPPGTCPGSLGTRTRGPRRGSSAGGRARRRPERGRDGRPEGWGSPRPPGALPRAASQPRSASHGTTSLRSSNSGTRRSSIGSAALSPPLAGAPIGCSGGSRPAPGAAGPSASYRARPRRDSASEAPAAGGLRAGGPWDSNALGFPVERAPRLLLRPAGGITESQNIRSWKGPTNIIEVQLLGLSRSASRITPCTWQRSPNAFWCCDCFTGEPVPVSIHHLGEELFS